MGGGEGEANNENDLILLDAVVVGHWQSLTLWTKCQMVYGWLLLNGLQFAPPVSLHLNVKVKFAVFQMLDQ